MQKIRTIPLMVAMLLALSASAFAADAWQPDPSHTTVAFTVRHQFVEVLGTFDDVQGNIVFDPAHPGKGSVDIEIAVDSVNTRNDQRDKHLQSADFFDSERYPKITFVSNDIRPMEGGRFVAVGKLTIKDVSKEIELPFTFMGTAGHPMKDNLEVAGFESYTTLDRLEYNVGDGKYYKMGVVGRNVHLLLFVEALKEK